jgi:transcriptional regulator CtsR
MRISDAITAYILHRMEETEDGSAELQRNVLAEQMGCVPSQITYVLTSRFTPAQGYIVESRRGGGGYIRVQRVKWEPALPPLMHVVNSIGEELVSAAAQAILENLVSQKLLSPETARVMSAALSDQAYREVPAGQRDRLRAALMKQMLASVPM